MNELKIGMKLQHYKGGKYTVLGFATCSETLEELVIYLAEDDKQWVRPLKMFYEVVIHEGKVIERFKQLKGLEYPLKKGWYRNIEDNGKLYVISEDGGLVHCELSGKKFALMADYFVKKFEYIE